MSGPSDNALVSLASHRSDGRLVEDQAVFDHKVPADRDGSDPACPDSWREANRRKEDPEAIAQIVSCYNVGRRVTRSEYREGGEDLALGGGLA